MSASIRVTVGAARLRDARERKGWTRGQLAEASGISESHLTKLERSERSIRPDVAQRLSDILDVPAEHLLGLGEAEGDRAATEAAREALDAETRASGTPAPRPDAMRVLEYDVGASAGAGLEPPALTGNNGTPVLAEWLMPADMLRAHTTPAAQLVLVRVEGDSMEPDYLPGDRVLVDLSRRAPSPPGVFVVWDGFGLVLKRAELLLGGEPRRVRLSSINPAYLPYEVPLADIHISGRVIGKWLWR